MSRPSKGAHLVLHKNRTYYIHDGDKRISTGGCSEADAERKLADYIASKPFRVEGAGQRDPQRLPCLDVLNYYYEEHAPKTNSLETIKHHLDRLNDYWGTKYVSDIRGSTCREYIAKRITMTFGRRRTPTTRSTASKELATLQAAVNFWHREFTLTMVPRVTKETDTRRRERVLERAEFARMLWQARRLRYPHLIRFLMIGRYTGTRQTALCKLRWLTSIDAGHMDLARGILYRRGAGEQETKKRRPPCELHPKLLWFARKWAAKDKALGITHVIHVDGGLPLKEVRAYWDEKTREPLTPWSKVLEAAGLAFDEGKGAKLRRTSDVKPHVLRHTCATWNLWEGRTEFDVAGIIGATAEVVVSTYGHQKLAVREYARKRAAARKAVAS